MITESQVEKAIEYLRDHAGEYAAAVGQCKFLDHKRKVVRAQAFLAHDGTVAEREARAEVSEDYRAILEEIREAETERALLQTNFKRAEMTIELYRTESANQRRGNI